MDERVVLDAMCQQNKQMAVAAIRTWERINLHLLSDFEMELRDELRQKYHEEVATIVTLILGLP
jgi:hypothetical protein